MFMSDIVSPLGYSEWLLCLCLTNVCYIYSLDEIRQDVEETVYRMKPWASEEGSALFAGWARMAQPIEGFNVVEVSHN